MTEPLFDFAPVRSLPLEKGGNLHVVLVYEPLVVDESGDPVLDAGGKEQFAEADWPTGATVTLVIDTAVPTTVPGVVAGPEATFDLDSSDADAIKSKLPWRVVLTHSTGLDEVLVKGVTDRKDSA